ncbi:hypothetical protein NEOLEDRAFT_1152621 [Neolentinus lepideus HHB14362 ss-1]|uniref:Uncharacterized protein n=1 Tax=Neolentinus lepideus HHB14362 ss-1 TaxID=1314782 RepID=A0A165MJT5_9AGAM|nr:hypothetical protein NEOLEDRAFT_1152621 [Neolentinus lepideus HHB14362 ss-1]
MSETPACIVIPDYDWDYLCDWCATGKSVAVYSELDHEEEEAPLVLISYVEACDRNGRSFQKEVFAHWDCVPCFDRVFYIKPEFRCSINVSLQKSHLKNLSLKELDDDDDINYVFIGLEWSRDGRTIGYPIKSMEQRLDEMEVWRGRAIIAYHRKREYRALPWPPKE